VPDIEKVKQTSEKPGRVRYRLLIITLAVLWLILAAVLWAYWGNYASRVEVTWETATEQQTAGFALYRREGENGEFLLVSKDHFIPSRGGPTSGAAYRYLDEQVEAGKTYYYLLEEIEVDGSRKRLDDDLLKYRVADNELLRTAVIIFCCILGAGMLFAGKSL
jgi:hypothetical protein